MNFYTAAEGSRKFGVPIPEEAIFGGGRGELGTKEGGFAIRVPAAVI